MTRFAENFEVAEVIGPLLGLRDNVMKRKLYLGTGSDPTSLASPMFL